MRRILSLSFVLLAASTTSLALADGPTATVTSTSTTTPLAPTAAATGTMPSGATTTTTGSVTTTTSPVGTTTTTQAGWEPPMAQPAVVTPPLASSTQYESTKTTWVNRPLLGTGLVLLGGTYTASAIVAAESTNSHDNPNLYYPVVGPWMDLGQRGAGAGDKVLLAFDGVGQGLGALAIVTSLLLPESKDRHWFIVGSDKVQVAPTNVGLAGYGLGASGKF